MSNASVSNSLPMVLGAAQLGMSYGINGLTEAPTQEQCDAILLEAWKRGVRSLDTARSYGESEARIGEFFRRHPECDFKLVSKLDGKADPANAASVRESIGTSFDKLCRQVDVLLLHNAAHLADWNRGLGDTLEACKKSGWIGSFGVSVYDPNEVETALEMKEISLIQVPLNVFDQRLCGSGLLERAETKGKKIFVRSVFLQGLLLMPLEAAERKLPVASPWLRKWSDVCAELKRVPSELAMNFVRAVAPRASLIFGCDSVEQVRANAELFGTSPLSKAELDRLKEFSEVPAEVYDPRRWRRA